MADRVDVKLKAKDPNNENTTTTISYVNPEATNGEMKTFAQKLNALTRNTYSSSDKIETTNLDLAPSGGTLTPTFTFSRTTFTKSEIVSEAVNLVYKIPFTYNGDGQIFISSTSQDAYVGFTIIGTDLCIIASSGSQIQGVALKSPVKVFATAGTNYKATEVIEITIANT